MNKFEEFLNTPISPASVARWLYVSSFAMFVFGAIITSSVLQNTEFTVVNVATAYLSAQNQNNIISAQISATSENVKYNNETTIMWRTKNANSCSVRKNGAMFSTELNGNLSSGKLKKDTKFTIECSSKTGKANAVVSISVGNPVKKPTIKLLTNTTSVDRDGTVKITWSSNYADSCKLMQGTNQINTGTAGVVNSQPITDATVIWLTCYSDGGSVIYSRDIQIKN